MFAAMRQAVDEEEKKEIRLIPEANEYEEDDDLLNRVMQDMQAYDEECNEMKADDSTRILLEVLEAQQNRTEEEWKQGGRINNEEVIRQLQEVWAEEDRLVAEALQMTSGDDLKTMAGSDSVQTMMADADHDDR